MKRWKTVSALALTALALGGPAEAATTLYTAPANATFGGDQIHCAIANVGKSTLKIGVYMRGYQGQLGNQLSHNFFEPGQVASMSSTWPADIAYCKFVIIGGSADDVRAQAIYSTTKGSRTVVVPAK